jgi:hypothetical protein
VLVQPDAASPWKSIVTAPVIRSLAWVTAIG